MILIMMMMMLMMMPMVAPVSSVVNGNELLEPLISCNIRSALCNEDTCYSVTFATFQALFTTHKGVVIIHDTVSKQQIPRNTLNLPVLRSLDVEHW